MGKKSLKRPVSAANLLFNRPQSGITHSISMKHIFQIYDRPPSGFMSVNSKKEKKPKKSRKKVKLKHLKTDNQDKRETVYATDT